MKDLDDRGPSELQKPHAREMPDLMWLGRLASEREGTVAGHRAINVLEVGKEHRCAFLYYRLVTSKKDEFQADRG